MRRLLVIGLRAIRLLLPAGLLAAAVPLAFAQAGDVIISTNTTWPEAHYSLNSLSVTSGATLTIGGGSIVEVVGAVALTGNSRVLIGGKNTTGTIGGIWQGAGATIQAGSINVQSGSSISADGQGYTTGQGPGGSAAYTTGGSYGGRGSGPSAAPYGSYLAPSDLGSAGGGASGGWSVGGGAIRLIVSGTLTNDGVISANGMSGGGNHAGASGGSVYVTAGAIAGTGSFTTNGNMGGNASGGGGRVAIYFVTNGGFSLNSAMASAGGAGAAAGSVYLLGNNTDLYVTTNLCLPSDTSASYGSLTVTNGGLFTLGGGSGVTVTGTVRVMESSTVVVQSKNNGAQVGGVWQGAGGTITAGTLQVDAGSSISADGQGYTTGQGPGGSAAYTTGGSYGGRGSGPSAAPYGSYLAPSDLGSAGGGASGGWSVGGGAIRLIVSGTLTNHGAISANGMSGGGNHAGASGGSIYVTAGAIAGTGSFTANGNMGSNASGGGGRVAIYFVTNAGFDPDLAAAGPGGAGATAGSAYLLANSNDLYVTTNLVVPPDASATYANVVVSNGAMLTLGGGASITASGTIRVTEGSTILVQSKNNSMQVGGAWQGAGATITAGNLQVDAGSRLTADGQGYTTGQGPGGSADYTTGGSYGGRGSGPSAAIYGSYLTPSDLGSAGGGASGGWSVGGGAIRLVVSGTLTNDGSISANGTSGGGNHAGASGGSIHVTTGAIAGTGSFAADGNAGNNASGGGGRIAVYYTDMAAGFDPASLTASAGHATAQPGSVLFIQAAANNARIPGGQLVVAEDASLSFNDVSLDTGARIVLGGGATLEAHGTLSVAAGATISVGAKNYGAQVAGHWVGQGATILSANLQIAAGGSITADGQGYATGQGPGGSVEYTTGGSHGGRGSGPSAPTYGSYLTPTDLGSAGGGAPGGWSRGGGAIRLAISGTLTNDGTISANGLSGGGNHAGGSGGSIYVTTGTIAGSGSIAADGNAGSNANGGGGRVAVYYTTLAGFDPASATAKAGHATAEPGSVLFIETASNDVRVPGGQLALADDSSLTFNDLSLENGGHIVLGGGATLRANGSLTLAAGTSITVRASDCAGQVAGQWVGRGATISAADLVLAAGARITADGQGYMTGQGPGGAPDYWTGGSYGGRGSGASAAPYGSQLTPTDLGSAGGAGYGGWSRGGGAIRLIVSGTLRNDGTISANGSSGGGNHGGASGGSIYVTTQTLAGSGRFEANGNAGSNATGGGGRIALHFSAGTFDPAGIAVSGGGSGATEGTVMFPVAFATSPSGLSYSVDGQAYASSQTLHWLLGSSHVIGVVSPQSGGGGTRYLFSQWLDGGALSHTVTASTLTTLYVAAFDARCQLSVDRPSLRFGVVQNASAGTAQEVTLSQNGAGAVPWVATSDRTWLQVSPGTGQGSSVLSIRVNPGDAGLQSVGTASGRITVSSPQAWNVATIDVVVTVAASTTTSAPFGQVDTPVQDASGIVGAVGVTGWALDDVGVTAVRVYRNCLSFENQANCQVIEGNRVVYIGDAAFLAGARPDVEAAFPGNPHAFRAGWGYLMLTSMLPHLPNGQAFGGQGALVLYVFARDAEGHLTLLGRSRLDHTPTRITLANDTIAKPFGAIDTPGQGQTVSGILFNFGWALTPDTDSQAGAGDILIPPDGSTMGVFIDGVRVGNVAYNQCRGSVGNPPAAGVYCDDDVANIFGNPTPRPTLSPRVTNPTRFRNLDAGRAAIGAFVIDTATLASGLHTIAWGVTDTAGRPEGIGSRFFTVLHAGGDAPGTEPDDAVPSDDPARVRGDAARMADRPIARIEVRATTGFGERDEGELVVPSNDGRRRVRMPDLGRLVLSLGPVDGGYLVVNGTLRDLPPGSHLDTGAGVFTWMPGPGYVGTYELVFFHDDGQIPVSVTVGPVVPSRPGTGEIRMYLDLPQTGATLSGGFRVAGWALDPQAATGSGIGLVHVWARRRDVAGATPVFLGSAELGGRRPDVGTVFGAQFDNAGFNLVADGLAAGRYDLTAYAWNRRTARWEDARTVSVMVR